MKTPPSAARILLLFVAALSSQLVCNPRAAAANPNIIVILADDLGYHDLGVQGGTQIPTPNLDALARRGIRFTSGYVTAPVCSPSRAGLMTGRYQQRFGHETNPGVSLELDPHFGLPLTETTVGNRLQMQGYSTGWIGKSHLGGDTNQFHPLKRGFDEYFGFIQSHHDYLNAPGNYTNDIDPILRGYVPVNETNYLTTAFARECVDYLNRHTNAPFFLYAPFSAIHFPLQATSSLQSRAGALGITNDVRRDMAAVLLGLDDAVGAIVARLRELNLETNTLMFFTSDNGGMVQLGSDNRPLRGGKTELYEGGIRVPFFMSWPGRLPTNTVVDAMVSTLDILPTAVAVAGGTAPAAWQLDGVNLLPYLLGQTTTLPHSNLFWRIETDGLSPGAEVKDGIRAVRQGDWKLVKPGVSDTWELYDLTTDIGESTNLALAYPDVVQRLVSVYANWSAQLARPLWAVDNLDFASPEFVLEDVRVGTTGVSYQQPQFLPGGAQVGFQDGANNLWLGAIDPATGFLVSGHGQDVLVDTNLAPLSAAVNGAQWGLSTNGPALFYNKAGGSGRLQIWRARLSLNGPVLTQLAASAANDLFALSASQEPTESSVKLAFNAGSSANSATYWADETAMPSAVALPLHAGGFHNSRWLPRSADIAYSGNPITQPVPTQIVRYRTATGTPQIISTNTSNKTDVCGFLAPEFNGELCYAAVVERTSIAIYRDLHDNPNGYFTQIALFTQPTNVPFRYLYSLEPLTGARGFNGVSYFSCAAYQNNNPLSPGDAEIWIFGLGPDAQHRLARRVDEGASSGMAADRRDPKTFIGDREVFVYYSRQSGTNPTHLRLTKAGLTRPDHQEPPSGFTSLQISRSFNAGTNDARGVFMAGTETMHLVAHKGMLFAGMGSRENLPYPATTNNLRNDWSGSQILVKESATAPWLVETNLPPIFRAHLRVEALEDFTFTTLNNATPLPQPVTLLVAGLSDIDPSFVGSTLASARTRNDTTGTWEESHVATTISPANVISFGSHVDRVTGVHHIFAGLENGEIYRGVYAPQASGKLLWTTNAPELSGAGPVTAFAECNGFLFAACGLAQPASNAPISGGLFVRRDTSNDWQLVYQWPHPVQVYSARSEDRLTRGLTTVPEPHGAAREVLLAARAWPGVIERIDPAKTNTVTVELDVRDFFARRWNDARVRDAAVTIGYTGFTAATNPVTGERVHLVGVWIEPPDTNSPTFNGTHFLIRHLDATYEAAEILNAVAGTPLRATRCIAVSPFTQDRGNVFYFGGYETSTNESHNTAWIQRGDWSVWPALTISRPNPPDWQLTWPATDLNWSLESSSLLGPSANWQPIPDLPTRSVSIETLSVGSQDPSAYYRLRKP